MNRERKILEVHVDKGMEDGQKITFTGNFNKFLKKFSLWHLYFVGEGDQ